MDNINTMAFSGEIPWHKKGKQLAGLATAEEMIVAAGLDWRVEMKPLYYQEGFAIDPLANYRAGDFFGCIRQDTNATLSVMKGGYTPMQNRHKFQFMDSVVGAGQAVYETAGALGRGEKVWILVRLPGEIIVAKDDVVRKYLTLYDSFDGTMAVGLMRTGIRVVCENTLNEAISSSKQKVKFRHTKGAKMRLEDLQETLGLVHKQYDHFGEASRYMAGQALMRNRAQDLLKEILKTQVAPPGMPVNRSEMTHNKVMDLFEGQGRGSTMVGSRGTAWGLYNAVTEYVDFHRATRGKNQDDRRTASLLFGSGAALKQRAWNLLQLA